MKQSLKPLALALGLLVVAGACVGANGSAAGASLTPTHTPLVPASPGADPVSLLAWLFNPIFQGLFIGLVLLDQVTGDIGIAILLLTIIIRVLLISPYRRQLVSQKRTQLLQPEVAEIQRRYKGDRARIAQAQQELYKSRGVSPLAGCLPSLLQFIVLIPMYSVISNGLTNPDPTEMLKIFGTQVIQLDCSHIEATKSCINPAISWLGWLDPKNSGGLNASLPWAPIVIAGVGLSPLALASALLQVVQTRMTLNPNASKDDPSARAQSQTMIFLPLISLLYGGILPAGLFIYWIASTVFSIVQQYFIIGFGGLFPLFGWRPAFAENHAPRFPVAMPVVTPAGDEVEGAQSVRTDLDRAASAAATIRSAKKRDRRGRRGGQ